MKQKGKNILAVCLGLFFVAFCFFLAQLGLDRLKNRDAGQVFQVELSQGDIVLEVPHEVQTVAQELAVLAEGSDAVKTEWKPETYARMANEEAAWALEVLKEARRQGIYPSGPGGNWNDWYYSEVSFWRYKDPLFGKTLCTVTEVLLRKYDDSESHRLLYDTERRTLLSLVAEGELSYDEREEGKTEEYFRRPPWGAWREEGVYAQILEGEKTWVYELVLEE